MNDEHLHDSRKLFLRSFSDLEQIVMRLRYIFIASSMLFVAMPSTAFAQDDDFKLDEGIYASVRGGVTSPSSKTFDGIQAPANGSPGVAGDPATTRVQFDEDFTVSGAVGYQIPTRLLGIFQPSVELEYNYSSPDIDGGSFNGGNQTFGGGADINSFTLNYRADVRFKEKQTVVPYVGAGVGIADVDPNIGYFPNNGTATTDTFAIRGNDTGFVLQGDVGLSFRLNDRMDLETGVRYQRISGLNFEREFVAGGGEIFNAEQDGRYETVSGLVGVRIRF
ncbi:MAG: outer membrane beta-barrel protein [Erythrobacter sp.]|nr:outer membrane beta-barrel protein [Erythrobacter sp.]